MASKKASVDVDFSKMSRHIERKARAAAERGDLSEGTGTLLCPCGYSGTPLAVIDGIYSICPKCGDM